MARERVQAQEAEKLSLKSLPRIWWSRIQTQVSLSSQSLSETRSFGKSLGLSRSGDMPNRTELPPGRDCSFVHLRVRMPAHSFWTESSEGSQRPLEGGRGPRTSSNNGFWDARTPGTWEMSEVNQERGSQWGNCQEHALPPTPACAPGGLPLRQPPGRWLEPSRPSASSPPGPGSREQGAHEGRSGTPRSRTAPAMEISMGSTSLC